MPDTGETYRFFICLESLDESRRTARFLKASVPGVKGAAARAAKRAVECLVSRETDFLIMDPETFAAAREKSARVDPLVVLVCGPGTEKQARAYLGRGAFDVFVREDTPGTTPGERFASYFRVLLALRRRFRNMFSVLERRYENLVNALPDIIYELDRDGRFSFVNDAVRLLGYAPDELIGKHFSALLHDMDAQAVDRDAVLGMYEGVATGDSFSPKLFNERRGLDRKTENLEIRIKRKPGSSGGMGNEVIASIISYGEVSAAGEYSLREGQREFLGSVGIIRDVTLRRKSEETLRKLYQAVDQLSAGVCVSNRSFELEYVNPAFSQVTRYPPADALGRDFFGFLTWTPERVREVKSLVLDGFDVRDETRVVKADGTSFYASVLLSPVRTPEGNITHTVAIVEDISARKTMEDLLRGARDAAEESVRAKSDFLANLGQELKGPVSKILSTAQLMRMAPLDASRNASQIIKSARELMETLSGVLEFVRSESSREGSVRKPFALGAFVRGVCEPYREQAIFRGLSFDLRGEGDGIVETDPDRLGRILAILLDNALKYTQSGTVTLEYSIERKEGNVPHLALDIRSVCGRFSPEDKARVFRTFPGTNADPVRGSRGLGFPLARNLVRALGGELRVDMDPDQGCLFSILLPVGDPAGIRAEGPLSGPPYSLLVVDDNEVNLECMRVLLKDAGHVVHQESGGAGALQALESRLVDAVFLDIQMPNMSGLETTRRIRASSGGRYSPEIPVIALTAFDPAELEYPGIRFSGVFTKPADIRKLLAAADRAVSAQDAASPVLFSEKHTALPERRQAVLDKAKTDGESALSALSEILDARREGKQKSGADIRREAEKLIRVFEDLAAPGAVFAARQLWVFFPTEDTDALAVRISRLGRAFHAALARLGE